ncbi:uncharacterized protein [Amphiura filiformis]|uniref:uncharacterized protein isoform X2 n=1 Tax=Amphiura filiformis TaxID=82378 RepID=UPI003B2232DE
MPISMDDFGMYTCVAINRRLFASSTSCILSREDEDASSSISIDGSQWPNPDDPKEVGECTKCTMGLEPPKSPLVHDEVFQQLQIEMAQMPDLPEPSVKEMEAPKFLKRLSDVTVDYGGRLILSAMVDDPFASVSWYHKEKLIGTCKHTEMVLSTSSRRRYAVLRIIPAWQDDGGKYTCIARGSVSKKGSISMCQVTVEESDNAIIERYNNKVCRQCPSDPSLPHERKVRVSGVQKLPTIQSVWSLSNSSSKGQFSTPSQNGEASVGQKRKAEDEELPPPPPDTPPRCPSPPLPMHDKDIPPLFVQKLTDRHRNPNSYKLGSPTLMLTCIVNVQSAKHEWYHNGKKLQSCKDTKLIRAVDKKNIGGNQQIALLQIDRLAHEDDGVYTCVATNDAGSISTSCFVGKTVIEETLAKLPILECEKCKRAKKKKVKEESGNKESSTSGGTEETQQDVQSGNNSEKKEPEVHVVQYLGNKPPEKNDNAPLVVTRELTGIKDIIERAITLKCRFSHTLLPITWVYMGHQIQECPHYQPEQEVVDGQLRASLKLTSLSPVDMGIYTCLAHNHIDPFVSTSCNLTVKSKPMNEYLKVCKKCICRKAERAAVYDAMVKKRRKLIEWEEANPGSRVPANTDVIHSYSRPRDQVNRLEPKTTTIATVKREPAGVMNVQYVLPKLKGSVLDTLQGDPMSDTPPMLLVPSEPTDTGNQTEPDNPRLWSTQPTVKETLADKKERVRNRRGRELVLLQKNAILRHQVKSLEQEVKKKRLTMSEESTWRLRNAELSKKLRSVQRTLERKTKSFTKQLKGELRNSFKQDRATQTFKRADAQTEIIKVNKRNAELVKKMSAMGARYGSANRQVAKLHNMLKDQQQKHSQQLEEKLKELELKHEATVGEMQRKNEELQAELQRFHTRESGHDGRQLQGRGQDVVAFTEFLHYIADPSQGH